MCVFIIRNFWLPSLVNLLVISGSLSVLIFISCQFSFFFKEGDIGICGVDVFLLRYAVNRISVCGDAVISNPSVCDVCVFHAAVLGEMRCSSFLFGLS